MVADRVFLSLAPRRRTISEAIAVVIAIGALAVRVLEMPASSFGLVRVLVSVAAISMVCFAPLKTLARRAFAIVAFEAIVGVVVFSFVDLPLVLEHRPQIDALAVSIVTRAEQFERTGWIR